MEVLDEDGVASQGFVGGGQWREGEASNRQVLYVEIDAWSCQRQVLGRYVGNLWNIYVASAGMV